MKPFEVYKTYNTGDCILSSGVTLGDPCAFGALERDDFRKTECVLSERRVGGVVVQLNFLRASCLFWDHTAHTQCYINSYFKLVTSCEQYHYDSNITQQWL